LAAIVPLLVFLEKLVEPVLVILSRRKRVAADATDHALRGLSELEAPTLRALHLIVLGSHPTVKRASQEFKRVDAR
jgi:hypothetical protein